MLNASDFCNNGVKMRNILNLSQFHNIVPYRLRICAMGEQAALDTGFYSLL